MMNPGFFAPALTAAVLISLLTGCSQTQKESLKAAKLRAIDRYEPAIGFASLKRVQALENEVTKLRKENAQGKKVLAQAMADLGAQKKITELVAKSYLELKTSDKEQIFLVQKLIDQSGEQAKELQALGNEIAEIGSRTDKLDAAAQKRLEEMESKMLVLLREQQNALAKLSGEIARLK